MNTYVLVLFKLFDNETFDYINNSIEDQQISFDVKKKDNIHYFDLKSNNSSFNINSYLVDKISDSINIITLEDYKSLIDLMYNENQSLIKYNELNIFMIQYYYQFDTIDKNIKLVQSKFNSYMQKK